MGRGTLQSETDVVETSADKQPEEAHTLRDEVLRLLRQAHQP